jgi:Uma2 family endonuclease
MSQTVLRPPAPQVRDSGIRRRRWTRDEYYRAAEVGVFRPDERLELLDGEILEKLSPQNPPHATALIKGARVLDDAFGRGHCTRQQLPLALNDESEPEPDLLVVPGTPDDYVDEHPGPADARLLVEIADTTLRLDRGRKREAYARAGIPEYWILNLPKRQLEVCRDPFQTRYRSVTTHGEDEQVTPLASPGSMIRVADLLPPARTRKRK